MALANRRQQRQQAAHGAHASRYADDADVDALGWIDVRGAQRGPPLEQGIDVGHGLGGMLVAAVAAVDDGDAQRLQHLVHGVGVAVAQHHQVAVMVEHLAHVVERLALGDAGGGGVGDGHDVAAQAVPGALERQAGAGAGFVEGADEDLAGQRPGDQLRLGLVTGGQPGELGQLFAIELARRDHRALRQTQQGREVFLDVIQQLAGALESLGIQDMFLYGRLQSGM